MSGTLSSAHSELLGRVRDAVAADERFEALLIGGSYVHGGLDAYSDLDFVLVVAQACYAEVMADRLAFAESLGGLVSAFTGEHVGEPRLLICLYGPPLVHIDLKFVVASDLDHGIERRAILFARDPVGFEARACAAAVEWPNHAPEWFEARAWIWLHYAAAKLGRGELYEAIGMLGFFREQVLGPMLYRRAGLDQRGVRRLEALRLDPEGRLADTVACHAFASVRAAIVACVEAYLDLRADDPPDAPRAGMPGLLLDCVGQARAADAARRPGA
ncbi:MAG: nucleotidyltransferase domain-containing protein [Castellaniella sp.]|uniref:nucleotidyltransferase domain-containing protein n=1 Tax=Castellaniella sp. TaxID=1955812 RepID=UPI003C78DD42